MSAAPLLGLPADPQLRDALIRAAERRNVPAETVAQRILEAVLADGLVDAVLDDAAADRSGFTSASPTTPKSVVDGLRLTPTERRLADLLRRSIGSWVPVERIVFALWGDDPNGGPVNAAQNVTVHVARLRRKLRGTGLAIEAGWHERRMVVGPEPLQRRAANGTRASAQA